MRGRYSTFQEDNRDEGKRRIEEVVVRNRIRIERISFGTYALLLLKHYYSGRKERYTNVQ